MYFAALARGPHREPEASLALPHTERQLSCPRVEMGTAAGPWPGARRGAGVGVLLWLRRSSERLPACLLASCKRTVCLPHACSPERLRVVQDSWRAGLGFAMRWAAQKREGSACVPPTPSLPFLSFQRGGQGLVWAGDPVEGVRPAGLAARVPDPAAGGWAQRRGSWSLAG